MLARADALNALTEERFDVLVIGGGVTGAGVAFDAASRGYSVAIVERADWASGTSSRSSKMVHGGLRYLQNFDLGLVREALLERRVLVSMAPHLVYPTPFLVPTVGEERRNRLVGIGLNMYDVMATTRVGQGRELGGEEAWSPERHRTIPGEEAAELVPALAALDPREAYLFYDCQTDDARLVLTILGEAERFGAVCANGLDAVELLDEGGRAAGAVCVDRASGARLEVRAANVVNATGVWADRLRPEEIRSEAEIPRIAPSRGTHITIATSDLDIGSAACVVPAGEDRTIFALPWCGRTLVGTTDRAYEGELDHVAPSGDDIDYLLDALNSFFGLELDRSRITGAYAGVRPLISSGDQHRSVDISRKAELYETSSGMLTITGGKLTTWRRMAKQVVDRLVEREGREAPCRTAELPLGMPASEEDLEPPPGVELPEATRDLLAFRYGHAARTVLALTAERPELASPIVPGMPDLLAEVVVAARHEQARSVGDVLLRRTRLGLLAAPSLRSADDVLPVARVLGGELGWDEGRVRAEAHAWLEEARAEGIDPAASGGEATGAGPKLDGHAP